MDCRPDPGLQGRRLAGATPQPGSFDDPLTALLLIAHRSGKAPANAELTALAGPSTRLGTDEFERVEAVFPELAEPGIEQGVASFVAAGVRCIVLLPYFLAEGSQVARDIPRATDAMRARYPGLELRLASCTGSAGSIAGLALSCAR